MGECGEDSVLSGQSGIGNSKTRPTLSGGTDYERDATSVGHRCGTQHTKGTALYSVEYTAAFSVPLESST